MIDKTGRVVWHDLFTGNRRRSMSFYQRVAGWNYKTEHATDFVWGGGAKDFVLALSGDEAGAGFMETPPGFATGWIAYVEVPDVDAAAALAEKHGGTIVRQPFDVPGVGRNALLRDPLGALIGLSFSRHDFPAPQRQFGVDFYLSETSAFPADFYASLFGWTTASSSTGGQAGHVITGPSGEQVAVQLVDKALAGPLADVPAAWIPSLKVTDPEASVRTAQALGGRLLSHRLGQSAQRHGTLLSDPDGTLACLVAAPGEGAQQE